MFLGTFAVGLLRDLRGWISIKHEAVFLRSEVATQYQDWSWSPNLTHGRCEAGKGSKNKLKSVKVENLKMTDEG